MLDVKLDHLSEDNFSLLAIRFPLICHSEVCKWYRPLKRIHIGKITEAVLKGTMVVPDFNPSHWEAVAGRYLKLRSNWSEQVPGHPVTHKEILS